MSNKLTRLDSFRELMNVPMLSNFDDIFKEGIIWPSMRNFMVDQKIKVDVSESEKSYTVKAELPGVSKSDIKVSVHGNQVTINCQVNKNKEEKQGETIIRSERYTGQLYRSFSLGNEIDDKKTTAKYSDGVLELVLPKKMNADEVKAITIE